jgi:uncharacterized protein YjbJ (UPF0337 family)
MDKDRITNAAKRAKDTVKGCVGRFIHTVKMEVARKAERAAGAARNAAGGAKDAARRGPWRRALAARQHVG